MKVCGILSSLILLGASAWVAAEGSQCAQINCDCSAITSEKWQSICSSQEKAVVRECQANGGKPQSYCGLHGPEAFPVAISLKKMPASGVLPDADVSALEKQIKTQVWSLNDSFKVVQAKETSGNFGDAIQLLGLYERDVDRLYELQHQSINSLLQQKKNSAARDLAETFALDTVANAKTLEAYSQNLWDRVAVSDVDKAGKAYKVMSLKLARLAASVYEQGADILGFAGLNEQAALTWQLAANIAKKLISLEASTDNKARHIEFYQEQASARLNRATYYWLKTDNTEQVISSIRGAEEIIGSESNQAIADTDAVNEIDSQDMRAMKRPSR